MASVTFDRAQRIYPGSTNPAVDDLTLDVVDGEFMVLVGPSGCGKSTSLRMLAGLEEVTAGEVRINERVVNDVPPKDRDIAMVFQNYALYPHMSVGDNMAFALKLGGVPKAERRLRVAEAAEMLDLVDMLERKPKALSGGQRQRVAMGRAIVRKPQVFCMDEPLSNLDAKLRVATRTQVAALQQRLGTTTVYVTHDQVEAMTMGDRVAVMKDGVLQQVDTPLALYDRPVNLFVAGFIGSPAMNLMAGHVTDPGTVTVDGYDFTIAREVTDRVPSASTDVTVGVRPEGWRLAADGEGGYPVTVTVLEELGADAYLYATPAAEGSTVLEQMVVRIPGRLPLKKGETVRLVPLPDQVALFDTVSGARLSA